LAYERKKKMAQDSSLAPGAGNASVGGAPAIMHESKNCTIS